MQEKFEKVIFFLAMLTISLTRIDYLHWKPHQQSTDDTHFHCVVNMCAEPAQQKRHRQQVLMHIDPNRKLIGPKKTFFTQILKIFGQKVPQVFLVTLFPDLL
jgi:hypothetical protein